MRIIGLDETSKKNILTDLLRRDPNQYGSYAGTVQSLSLIHISPVSGTVPLNVQLRKMDNVSGKLCRLLLPFLN